MKVLKLTFWNIFFGKIKSVNIESNNLTIIYKNESNLNIDITNVCNIPIVSKSIFGNKLQFKYNDQNVIVPFISNTFFPDFIDYFYQKYAASIEKKIDDTLNNFLNIITNEYLRDSKIKYANNIIEDILQSFKAHTAFYEKYICTDIQKKINKILLYYPVAEKSDYIRQEYEKKRLIDRKDFYDSIESNPLTDQQRLAVIRNNDINMVLAAAGTGKTSVMVAKALDIIDSGMANSDEILILAYNKSAAEELSERLKIRADAANLKLESLPTISTFHALGRKIMKDCGLPTYLSKFVDDPNLLTTWFYNWLKKYLLSSNENIQNFLNLIYQPVDEFSFQTKEEYDNYIRDNEYRTLQGERVRGYQELLIANWLFMHSVPYKYEEKYVSKKRIEVGFDYKPDFHLLNTNIYIEHFGIDREGNTRPDIDKEKYNSCIRQKRLLHREHGTVLLETFHYEYEENILFNKLETLMKENGIETKEKSNDEIFKVLNESGIIKETTNNYLKCLAAIRTERLNYDSVLERLEKAHIERAKEYAFFLMDIHNSYLDEVHGNQEIDFDDMILQATELIENKSFKPKWKYMLVDEFQDISMARLELLQAIYKHGPSPVWTVVGDDWQSIYRFSGGKLEATTRFKDFVGNFTLSKLEKTYRYNNSIADTAGTFIMENEEQYKKNVTTHTKVDYSCIYLYDSGTFTDQDKTRNISNTTFEIYKKIRKERPNDSIAILARYRYLLDDVKKVIKDKNIKFWTFHGSKGLEADSCILIGFFQGKTGFPNQNKEEAVVEALLPMLDTYPHSEERRLFYVAMTRAKNECYIIADPTAPSLFINELLSPKYRINIESECFKIKYREIFKCNLCSTGYYTLQKGPYGNFYSCSSGVVCKSAPRICEKCGAPSIDYEYKSVCQNPNCKYEFPICEVCGRPMKLRNGKFGQFWGCSGYGIKNDQCTNTRKYIEDKSFWEFL